MRRLSSAGAICLVGVLLTTACGSKGSPSSPSTPTGTIGARIDSTCGLPRNGITSVTVTIDGVVAGSTAPGGAVTKIAPVGTHTIIGRADNTSTFWAGDVVVTTAANPDSIKFFACI